MRDDTPNKELQAEDTSRPGSQTTLTPPMSENASPVHASHDLEAAKELPHNPEINDSSDPNMIGWDGPDDPTNPMNWPEKKKWATILSISVMTLLTPLGSAMFAPGVPGIMREFNSTNEKMATFVVSVYVLGFAFGPLVAAPMSEIYGRARCYNVANVFFIIFTVATALSQNMGMLIAFRFFMGFAGSTPITNGSGTISDMFPVEQRGKAMSIWAMGPMLGPCVGPVAGGYMIEAIGWRWVFWVIAIAGGVISIVCFFFNDETFHPIILQNKVNRLKKETGNTELRSILDANRVSKRVRFEHAIVRPSKLLFTHLPVMMLSLYIAVIYGILYLLFTTFTFVFSQQYGFGSGTIGLTYLPTGIGMMIGAAVFGALTDMIVKKKMASGGAPNPEDRLPIWMTAPSGILIAVSFFWYGWSIEEHTHWIVPMLALVVFCFGLMGIMMCVQVYLVDSYTNYAASVIAAITVLRSLAGALIPLGGLEMYNELGIGWGNSLLGFIALALVPVPSIFRFWGAKIRGMVPNNLQ